jgi:hypothetical protein
MILSMQSNLALITSIILFFQLISNISHAGIEDEKQTKKESNRYKLMEHKQRIDNKDIDNVLSQAESFKTFYILPDTEIENVTDGMPKLCEYPLTYKRAEKTHSMLNCIYVLGLVRAIFKDTLNYKMHEFDKIEKFFKKLKNWQDNTSEEADPIRNDLSEMSAVLNQSNLSRADLMRDPGSSGFESPANIINNLMEQLRNSQDTARTLILLLNFLSANDVAKKEIEPKLSESIYENSNSITNKLLEVHICPKEENFSYLTAKLKLACEFTVKFSGGETFIGNCPDFESYQQKRHSMMSVFEDADANLLKKELHTAIKAIRYFHYSNALKRQIDVISDKAIFAIDADPNNYNPNTTL